MQKAECSFGVCESDQCKATSGCRDLILHNIGGKRWWNRKGLRNKGVGEGMAELEGGGGIQTSSS